MLDGVAELPREQWNALVADDSPFLEWDWLASLEQAEAVGEASGWLPKPLVARDGDRLIAACPLYLKHHSEGEFVFDWDWADAALRAGIRYYPKLLVGVPFTPVKICDRNDLSGVHVNFTRHDECEPLDRAGYQLRVGIQYQWHNHGYSNFDDYLARFRSKRRNQIRRERREMLEHGVVIEVLCGDEIDDALFEPMFDFYRSTIETHYYGRQYLNRAFFELLRQRFKNRLCFVIARQHDEVIAGTLNVVKGGVFYGRYWGATRPLRHLHFNVCYYAAIEYCIAAGIHRFEPGAGGDYKFLRGFDAQPTYSLHYLREQRLADAVSRFLASERRHADDAIRQLRDQSALKPGN